MADSCRTSRKGRTKPDDATLWRGSIAKASAMARALRNLPGRRPIAGCGAEARATEHGQTLQHGSIVIAG